MTKVCDFCDASPKEVVRRIREDSLSWKNICNVCLHIAQTIITEDV